MSEETRMETALRHLGEEVRFVNLAEGALRQSRRMRARRNLVVGTGVALAVTAITLPYVYFQLDPETRAPQALAPAAVPSVSTSAPSGPASPAPVPPGAVELPGRVFVASSSSDSGARIYDRYRRGYRKLNYPQAWAAPVGNLVVVADRTDRLGILGPASDAVRWIPGSKLVVGPPQWSSDGARLVFAGPGSTPGTLSIVVVEVATARARILQPAVPCVEFCQPSWLPGGTEVGLPPMDQPTRGLQAYTVGDGKPSRFVTLPGAVQSGEAWSPDGRFVVAEVVDQGTVAIGVIEVATGTVTATLAAARRDSIQARSAFWATDDRLVVGLDREVVVFSTAGTEVDRIPLPATLRGTQNQLGLARP